jgi:nucleoside-diphosphate-sugar epimerase
MEPEIMKRRVFVTGASGYLGSAIAARLVRAGHEVWGLTRSEEKARSLAAAGIQPVIGDLASAGDFHGPLKNADVAVHVAADSKDAAITDQHALAAIRHAAQDGRVRRVLYTSGHWVYGDTNGQVVDETTALAPLPLVAWRAAHEDVVLDLTEFEVDAMVMRVSNVYGETRGILGGYFAEGRDHRTVTCPGDGSQFWGMVHRDDVAEAYALALEHGRRGERYIVCDESQLTAKQILEAIAHATGAELKLWDKESVLKTLGPYGEALLTSQKCTALKARRDLGWVPRHSNFVREVDDLYREWQAGREAPVA